MRPYGGHRSGQLTLTGSAQQITTLSGTEYLEIRQPTGNNPVWVGNDGNNTVSSTTGVVLYAGESREIRTSRPENIYIIGTALEVVHWAVDQPRAD